MRIILVNILLLYVLQSTAFAKTFCVAHRGNNIDNLENSWESILSAYREGANAIEFDIRHTLDGVPIIIHDKNIKRVASKVNSKDCKERKSVKHQFYFYLNKHCYLKNGEKIPRLKDVLNFFKNRPTTLFLEYKDMPNLYDLGLIKEFVDSNGVEKLVIISSKKAALNFFKLNKNFVRGLEDLKLLLVELKASKKSLQFDGTDAFFIKKKEILEFKEADKLVGVWTVNSEKSMKKYLDLGVDYITTDDIKKCLKLVGQ